MSSAPPRVSVKRPVVFGPCHEALLLLQIQVDVKKATKRELAALRDSKVHCRNGTAFAYHARGSGIDASIVQYRLLLFRLLAVSPKVQLRCTFCSLSPNADSTPSMQLVVILIATQATHSSRPFGGKHRNVSKSSIGRGVLRLDISSNDGGKTRPTGAQRCALTSDISKGQVYAVRPVSRLSLTSQRSAVFWRDL